MREKISLHLTYITFWIAIIFFFIFLGHFIFEGLNTISFIFVICMVSLLVIIQFIRSRLTNNKKLIYISLLLLNNILFICSIFYISCHVS